MPAIRPGDQHTPRPRYSERLLDPTKLTPRTIVRRYYYFESEGWRYTDYVVTGAPFSRGAHLCVNVRWVKENVPTTLYLSDMGIVREDGGSFNPRAYTVLL